MKRVLIIGAAVLLLAIIAIAVFLNNNMDSIVKGAIEKNGSAVLGTEVSVGSVDISLKSGRGTIRDVRVKNPDGYKGDAFTLAEITLDVQVASINKDPIVIDEVSITGPSVHVILDEKGRSNITVIKEACDRYQSSSAGRQSDKKDSGYEKRFRIDRFSFEEGRLEVDASALGQETIETTLPPLRLTQVGGPGGDTPDGIGRTVTRAFLAAAMGAVGKELKGRAMEDGKEAAQKALEKLLN